MGAGASVSGDAEFEVPVGHFSGDGPAGNCLYGPEDIQGSPIKEGSLG